MAHKHKWQAIRIRKSSKSFRVLLLLVQIGVIAGFIERVSTDKKSYYTCIRDSARTWQIFTYLTPTRKYTLKLKHINRLAAKDSGGFIYLTTPKGVISAKDAAVQKVGGHLFFRVI